MKWRRKRALQTDIKFLNCQHCNGKTISKYGILNNYAQVRSEVKDSYLMEDYVLSVFNNFIHYFK